MSDESAPPIVPGHKPQREERRGVLLVFLSALSWSFGGAIARFLEVQDSWAIIFWRSLWASLFLLGFMLLRDGGRGTLRLFSGMGWPGIAVGLCFATASSSFVVALAYTTVANILLMQAGGAADRGADRPSSPSARRLPGHLAGDCGGHRRRRQSWSRSPSAARVSPIGDGLAILIAVMFAVAT